MTEAKFSELLGKTLSSIQGGAGSDEVLFTCSDGSQYRLYHDRDCCESVYVEDVVGDMNDLIGQPLLQAEEASGETPADHAWEGGYEPSSYTWTFYKLATFNGSVTLRWLGESNGYYSESVSFAQVAGRTA